MLHIRRAKRLQFNHTLQRSTLTRTASVSMVVLLALIVIPSAAAPTATHRQSWSSSDSPESKTSISGLATLSAPGGSQGTLDSRNSALSGVPSGMRVQPTTVGVIPAQGQNNKFGVKVASPGESLVVPASEAGSPPHPNAIPAAGP